AATLSRDFHRNPNVVLEPQRLVAHTPLLAAVAACRGDFSIVDARSVRSIPAAASSFADGAFASLLRRFFTGFPVFELLLFVSPGQPLIAMGVRCPARLAALGPCHTCGPRPG